VLKFKLWVELSAEVSVVQMNSDRFRIKSCSVATDHVSHVAPQGFRALNFSYNSYISDEVKTNGFLVVNGLRLFVGVDVWGRRSSVAAPSFVCGCLKHPQITSKISKLFNQVHNIL
jgi:hypothetical protein